MSRRLTRTQVINKIQPRPVLELDYHLSYPFVFQYQGDFYMMPETKQSKCIQIFKATNFPTQWEPHHVVMNNVEAVDSSLLEYNGKWWLFTNLCRVNGASSSEELHLFYSESPFSDKWQAHPLNPLLSDVRRSRNAGTCYISNGKLFRPSQDCGTKYGYSVGINEITELSETNYAEKPVGDILPKWDKNINGVHTLVHCDDLRVSDVRKYFWFSVKK